MSEDWSEILRKEREDREKKHIKIKGILEGIRLANPNLSGTEKDILSLSEITMDGFKDIGDALDYEGEGLFRIIQRLDRLEKEVKQLKNTLDTLEQNR